MTELPKKEEDNTLISDVSIARLLDNGLVCLQREMKNLMMLTARGKLQPPEARDLRDTVKLLFELKDREKDLLGGLTDEQLEELNKTKDEVAIENNIPTTNGAK